MGMAAKVRPVVIHHARRREFAGVLISIVVPLTTENRGTQYEVENAARALAETSIICKMCTRWLSHGHHESGAAWPVRHSNR